MTVLWPRVVAAEMGETDGFSTGSGGNIARTC